MRGPVVQEGERLAEALLTNHQVLSSAVIMVKIVGMILMIYNFDYNDDYDDADHDHDDHNDDGQELQLRMMLYSSGAGEPGEPGGGAGGQAAPPHLGLPHHHGQAGWGGESQ